MIPNVSFHVSTAVIEYAIQTFSMRHFFVLFSLFSDEMTFVPVIMTLCCYQT